MDDSMHVLKQQEQERELGIVAPSKREACTAGILTPSTLYLCCKQDVTWFYAVFVTLSTVLASIILDFIKCSVQGTKLMWSRKFWGKRKFSWLSPKWCVVAYCVPPPAMLWLRQNLQTIDRPQLGLSVAQLGLSVGVDSCQVNVFIVLQWMKKILKVILQIKLVVSLDYKVISLLKIPSFSETSINGW
jgi:hypothetical protein